MHLLGVSRGVAAGPAAAIARPAERAAATPRYDLRPGTPDLSLFPRAAWAAAQRRALREVADADLGYPPSGGHPRLRAALAAYLGRVRGVQAAPERIVVCGGVAEAVALVARVLRAGGARRVAAGLHLLARLPPGRTEDEIVAAAAARDVAVDALGPQVAAALRAPSLLLGYTRLGEAGVAEAGRRLRLALD